MRTLITQTLLGSWLYTFSCTEGYEEEAFSDFLRTLNREGVEQTEAMRKGIEFENGVYALADDPISGQAPSEWREVSGRIADILRGGQIQVRGSRTIAADGDTYLLYGIADGMKAGIIYDVKFKAKNFKELDLAGSYLDSPQHPAYFRIWPEAYRFVYLVSDGKELYTEAYDRQDVTPIETTISQFRAWLRSRGLEQIYLDKWAAL